jgi:hypothetical protein
MRKHRIVRTTIQDLAELKVTLEQRLRFTQFMACDHRAVDSLYGESVYACIGFDASDMDVEDFTHAILQARVDIPGQDDRVMQRWGM